MAKVKVHLSGSITMNLTTETLRKRVVEIDGLPFLVEDGDHTLLKGTYSELMAEIEEAEKNERDGTTR